MTVELKLFSTSNSNENNSVVPKKAIEEYLKRKDNLQYLGGLTHKNRNESQGTMNLNSNYIVVPNIGVPRSEANRKVIREISYIKSWELIKK